MDQDNLAVISRYSKPLLGQEFYDIFVIFYSFDFLFFIILFLMRFSGRILKETKLKIFLKSPDIFRDGKLLVHLHPMSLSVPSKAQLFCCCSCCTAGGGIIEVCTDGGGIIEVWSLWFTASNCILPLLAFFYLVMGQILFSPFGSLFN